VALATKWFVKRLPLFRAEYPHISILLDTTDDLVDFSDPAIDAALRFSAGRVDGLSYERLTSEKLVPVIAPRLLKSLGRPFRIEDVTEFPMLQDDFDPKWRLWMAMVLPDRDLPSKPSSRFRDSAVLIEAAIDGQGIALVRYLLAKDDIAMGRLAVIDARDVDLARSLSLVCRPGDRENTKLAALRTWLRSQLGSE
jgi:LysR family glycine cleavage system transcriptional activator